MFPKITAAIESLDTGSIAEDRKILLNDLADYIQSKIDSNEGIVRLNFICTHNSRRSHFSQIWAHTLAKYFQLKNVECYSGGTESTAIFPMVVKTFEKLGFEIDKLQDSTNPIYGIKSSENELPLIGFSKKYHDFFNPQYNYGAIMTCTEADNGCPIVQGCDVRIPISYKDPKAYDQTYLQEEKYLECSRIIACEMKYVFEKASA